MQRLTDARKTVAKVKKLSKPFARKIQILTVGEQRAKVMKKIKSLLYLRKEKNVGKAKKERTKIRKKSIKNEKAILDALVQDTKLKLQKQMPQ